jgi:hypothetical protein
MIKSFIASAVLLGSLIASAPLQASPVFSHYRGVTLGDSVASVMTELKADAANLKVLHEVPSLIQELTWRPQRPGGHRRSVGGDRAHLSCRPARSHRRHLRS